MVHPVEELEAGGNAEVAMIGLWIVEESGFVFGGGGFSAVGGGDGEPAQAKFDEDSGEELD